MSGAITASTIAAVAAGVAGVAGVASTVVGATQGNKQAKATKNAAEQAQATALKQEKAVDEANNRANQKRANTGAIMDAALQSGKAGASGTMLTGPTGISPDQLTLGRSTLLGQ